MKRTRPQTAAPVLLWTWLRVHVSVWYRPTYTRTYVSHLTRFYQQQRIDTLPSCPFAAAAVHVYNTTHSCCCVIVGDFSFADVARLVDACFLFILVPAERAVSAC